MRFNRHHRVYPYEATGRKLAAAERRLRLDREKLPLFAEEIAESQPTPSELLERRGRAFVDNQQMKRDKEAADWRRARTILREIPEPERAAFIRYWNRSKCPGNAGYLLSYLHMFGDGRLTLHEGEVYSIHELQWTLDRKAKIAAMSDAELDRLIQTHFSPLFVEWGREERRRRAEAAADCSPAPRRRRSRRKR